MNKSIDIIRCNVGHYDYKWSNVAYAFSKRITGCVVASDGNVISGLHNDIGLPATFTSAVGDDFYWFCTEDRDNYGWAIYKYVRRTENRYLYTNCFFKTVTIKTIIDFVKEVNYFSSCK